MQQGETLTKIKEPVLLLAITQVDKNKNCYGAIGLYSKKCIRLLMSEKYNTIDHMPYKIGEVWDLEYIKSPSTIAPHHEDVYVIKHDQRSIKHNTEAISSYLSSLREVNIWEGSVDHIFDQKLQWTNGGIGYLTEDDIPNDSVGFWKTDKDIHYTNKGSDWYYYIDDNGIRKHLKYAGKEEVKETIPKGTLIRVSLTRWLTSRRANIEARAYLQLSGWYE